MVETGSSITTAGSGARRTPSSRRTPPWRRSSSKWVSIFHGARSARFTENEGGGYLISFPDFPGVVASGAMPENAIQRGRDALDVYRSTIRRAEILNAAV
jgi:predicted RNase H-like HicB family nuclease